MQFGQPLPEIRGNGPILVIGTGRDVWAELRDFGDGAWRHSRMVLNLMGRLYRRHIDHWAMLQPNLICGLIDARRRLHQRLRPFHVHAAERRGCDLVDVLWPLERCKGTVGLFGAMIARLMGYAPIILAGVPLDSRGHCYGDPEETTRFGEDRGAKTAWRQAAENGDLDDVYSLSGWTRELLGAPT